MMIRELERAEIDRIWDIDRSEVIDGIYHLEHGQLVLRSERCDMDGWPPGEADTYAPILYDCFDRGGAFYGAFDGTDMVGVVALESRFIGSPPDQLQLKILQISRAYRKGGLGRKLFDRAVDRARELNAKRLYITATPSENTIDFYMHLGCAVTRHLDAELYELEPEDIHLEYRIP